MKLLKGELRDKIYSNAYAKVVKHAPWNTPVRKQIEKNFGWWRWDNDGLIWLKIFNTRWNIRNDLNETD